MKRFKHLIAYLSLIFAFGCLSGCACEKTSNFVRPNNNTTDTPHKDIAEIIYFESITLTAVNVEHVSSTYDAEANKYTFVADGENNLVIKFKAEVLPANATNKKVKLSYDTEIATFDEPDENGFFNINVLEGGVYLNFDVVSTDGKDVSVHAKLLVL